MIRLEETITVALPIKDVFKYTSDFANIDEWDPGVADSEKISPGPVGIGSEFKVILKFAFRKVPMNYRIVEFHPPEMVVLKGVAENFQATDTIRFETIPSGTCVHYIADIEFKGPFKKGEPFLKHVLKRVGKSAVDGLQEALSNQFSVYPDTILNTLKDKAILPGMIEFTRWGYTRSKSGFQPMPLNLEGTTALVTGATSGIGYATATKLSKMGARVIVVGIKQEDAEIACEKIIKETGNTHMIPQYADISLIRDVQKLSETVINHESKIHILVNNAGALFNERIVTEEGFEKSFALLLLGPFLLTQLLMPKLKESRPARIINVTSGGMYTQKIKIDDLMYEKETYNGDKAYARAKRGLVILTEIWAEKLKDEGISVNAMHPGWVDTPGVKKSLPQFYKITKNILRTPEEGADTILWLAASTEAEEVNGKLWLDRRPHITHVFPGTKETKKEREHLWKKLHELAGL